MQLGVPVKLAIFEVQSSMATAYVNFTVWTGSGKTLGVVDGDVAPAV